MKEPASYCHGKELCEGRENAKDDVSVDWSEEDECFFLWSEGGALQIDCCPWCGVLLLPGEEEIKLPLPSELPPALFDLVALSTLPEFTWKGRAVFHPCEQSDPGMTSMEGITAYTPSSQVKCSWVADEYTGSAIGTACYDVGVVERWEPDPDFADIGVVRVWFRGSNGSVLHYASSNLWTPRLMEDKGS